MDEYTDLIIANASKAENWEDQEKTTDDVVVLREQFKKRLHAQPATSQQGEQMSWKSLCERETMDEYTKGFLEGLQAAVIIGDAKWKLHFRNVVNRELSEDDQEAAVKCTAAIGCFVSDIKGLAASVHRKEVNPHLIAEVNENYWWAREDGKGKN